jgi:NADH-quinone oxidoreductase subunit L
MVLARGFNALGRLLSQPIDLGVIDGAVNGLGRLTRWASDRLRRVQTGYVRMYAITLLLGVVFVIVIILLPLLQAG